MCRSVLVWNDGDAMNKNAQKICDEFNTKYKVGTKGWIHFDSGEKKATHTTSKAQVIGGHSAVIWAKGISGCYLLNRFEPAY